MPPIPVEPPEWHDWPIPDEMEIFYALAEAFGTQYTEYLQTPTLISWWLVKMIGQKSKMENSLGTKEMAALKAYARMKGVTD